jgi:hypothetical protein
MQTVKSIPVRKNYYRNDREVSVYLALVPIPCEQCRISIEPDEMFSRSADKQGKIIGIRYSFCRKCMPFEESPPDVEERKARINNSKELEREIQCSTDWQFLAGCSELVNFRLDKNGNAEITDSMGMPFNRDRVVWLMRIAQRYLEQHSAEKIDDLLEQWYDQMNSPRRSATIDPCSKKQVQGYIYLLYGGGYFKIGKTIDLSVRSRQISLHLPFEVTLIHSISTQDINEAEKYWHTKFKSKRLHGEWFSLSDKDVDEFSSMEKM